MPMPVKRLSESCVCKACVDSAGAGTPYSRDDLTSWILFPGIAQGKAGESAEPLNDEEEFGLHCLEPLLDDRLVGV
jgi:hypothetical protein